MDLLAAIANLYSPDMLHAIAVRAGAFWLAEALTVGIVVILMTTERKQKIWRQK